MKFDHTRRRVCRWGLAAPVAALAGAIAPLTEVRAADFPDRPITIVVPFPPGGSTDLLARRIGAKLSVAFHQSVIIENRGGAGGTTGSGYVARAKPDGYTLLFGVTGTNAISASLYPHLSYDPLHDLTAVSLVVSAPLMLVVNADSPIHTLADYVAAAKAAPGKLTFGSPGNGTSMHLTGEMFAHDAGIKLTHIAYRGSAPALQDLLGGQITSMFGDIVVVSPEIRAGKLRPLAVTSSQRHPAYPNVPTIAESGYPHFEALSWQGVFAPAKTPAPVLERLNREIVNAAKSPDLKEFFATLGFIVEGRSPKDSNDFVAKEIPKWAAAVKQSGAQIE